MGLIVDNFAGGGGASTGIEAALGRAVDIAINHDEQAIRMHEVNHPGTLHIRNNIWLVDPLEATGGRPVDLAWFSPDCKHFSKAKGGKPREKSIRDLAWVVVHWVQRLQEDARRKGNPDWKQIIKLICIENVEEFQTWGPLCDEGEPIKDRSGETFQLWMAALKKCGGKIEFRELRACDYGAPTIRKRLFIIIRFDGNPIAWPEPTHGKPGSPEVLAGKVKPWRTAAEIIDWTISCPSIFERKKPLADKTLRRIAHGIMKFVINNPSPFIVPLTHHGSDGRSYGLDTPLHTVTGANRGEMALVSPIITYAQQGGSNRSAEDPLHTISAGGTHMAEVRAFLIKYYGNEQDGHGLDQPIGTVTVQDRFGLVTVTVDGAEYVIVDIGMRMLSPRELFNAQGFPPDYIIDRDAHGTPMTKTAQVAKCGNSVCPPLAEALVRANAGEQASEREAA